MIVQKSFEVSKLREVYFFAQQIGHLLINVLGLSRIDLKILKFSVMVTEGWHITLTMRSSDCTNKNKGTECVCYPYTYTNYPH